MTPEAIAQEAQDAGLPASIELPTCNVADKSIDTGSEAKCFADYMRIHALESHRRSDLRADGSIPVGREPGRS